MMMMMMMMWTILVGAGSFWFGGYLVPKQPRRDTREANCQTKLQPPTSSSAVGAWQPDVSNMTINSLRQELSRRRLPTTGSKEELVTRMTSAMSGHTG